MSEKTFRPMLTYADECHHAASDTISKVHQEIKARYVYGVTATPVRGDGLERINYMLLGPIRYRYTSKERAKTQGIDHLVYPRFTRTVMPRGVINEKMHPNEAYELIRNNEVRDEQILADVRGCLKSGRTPVILSRYKDHSERLFERVKAYADHVFLLTGNMPRTKKRHLMNLVIPEYFAHMAANSRKGYWRTVNTTTVKRALSKEALIKSVLP